MVTQKEADSLRAANNSFGGSNKALNDSLNMVLNEIFSIEDKYLRQTRYNSFISSPAYIKSSSELDAATNRIIYVGNPIIVDTKYVFFTLFLGNHSRHFQSLIYFYEKSGADWHLVKKADWNTL